MEIHLIRHTTPNVAKGICYGQTDLQLAESYQEEFDEVLTNLPSNLEIIFTSPLKRCMKLVEAIQAPKTIVEPRLIELNFGGWEMKPWNEIPKEELNPWMADFINIAPPKGESMQQLSKRVNEWLEDLRSFSYQNIAVVTHAGPIRALLSIVNQTPLVESFKIYTPKYGEVFKLEMPNSKMVS